MKLFMISGRIQIDLYKVAQRDYKLPSYKLDKVAEYFYQEDILKIIKDNDQIIIYTKNISILEVGNYIKIILDDDSNDIKYKIIEINHENKYFLIDVKNNTMNDIDEFLLPNLKLKWGLAKDDIKPSDIFKLHEGSSSDRKIIANYCIQDCALVNHLINKLEILTNNISMANVCSVPLYYIFFRGQGIKCLSLVAKQCRLKDIVIPVLKKKDDDEDASFEGAVVFEPKKGFYKKPIPVLDYNSLYPSSIISKNVSHEMLVIDPKYDNLPDYIYYDVEYNSQKNVDDNTLNNEIIKCRFAKSKDSTKFGIIPDILMELLAKRKQTKKLMEKEPDEFKKKILDGEQNALKVTANSIYGQLGAPTSPILLKHLAACTTAIGRTMLKKARDFVENNLIDILDEIYQVINNDDHVELLFKKYIADRDSNFEKELLIFLPDLFNNYLIKPDVVYGDTDSIFINMDLKLKNGFDVYDKKSLSMCIFLGKISSKFLKINLPFPHNMEYEKTFYPFALMEKKKYIGNKYESDPNKYKQTSMGVVLKRRDNAGCVKKLVGGIVNIMMNEIDIDKTIKFVKKEVKKLLDGKYPMKDFITSKTLKGNYKNRDRIAHVILADRMTKRDPGNAPAINDRIQFAVIEKTLKKGEKILQGEIIEHPDFIKENKLKIDYIFYLTNQIMNPAIQFLALVHPNPTEIFNVFINEYNNKKKGIQNMNNIGLFIKDEGDDFLNISNDMIVNLMKINENSKPRKK